MLFLFRPSLFAAGIACVAFVFGAHLATRAADSRFDAAKERADTGCRAYRASPRHADADVCRDDMFKKSSLKMFKEAKDEIASARVSYEHNDNVLGRVQLARALDLADEMDRRGTIIGALMASKTINDALDLIEARKLPSGDRLALLGRVTLSTAEAPLESERVHRQWLYTHVVSDVPGGPVGRAVLADQLREDDIALAEMNRALLAGDDARCQAAAHEKRGAYQSGLDDILCGKMREVVRTGARLERAKTDAIRGSDQPMRRL